MPEEAQFFRMAAGGYVLTFTCIPDATWNFSDEMNRLIGMRGSGKSAVLISLRYASELLSPASSEELDLKYKQEFVRFALGSIDEPAIQKAIVSIIKGGHDAFARRKEI
jgi:predicted ATP-dependent endonuclease of OLD family